MTTVLNRKFDLLARSGTCPPYLLDVLSLLVAHANDTELLKTELRSGPLPAGSATRLSEVEARSAELALQESARASHETILLAAEHSLRAYAEDLRQVNQVALATARKELRELRAATRQEMDAYRDDLCAVVQRQSSRDLEVLRGGWLEAVRGEAERIKAEVDAMASGAEAAVRERTDDYAAFVARAYDGLRAQPAVDAHEALAASNLVAEQVALLSASAAAKADVDRLADRLKQAERAIARMSASLFDEDAAAQNGHARGDGSLGSHAAGGSPAAPAAAQAESECDLPYLGVNVEEDPRGDGVVVTAVLPRSRASDCGMAAGFLLSHVGKTAVTSFDELWDALAAAVDSGVESTRLTVYDPAAARVRVLTLTV